MYNFSSSPPSSSSNFNTFFVCLRLLLLLSLRRLLPPPLARCHYEQQQVLSHLRYFPCCSLLSPPRHLPTFKKGGKSFFSRRRLRAVLEGGGPSRNYAVGESFSPTPTPLPVFFLQLFLALTFSEVEEKGGEGGLLSSCHSLLFPPSYIRKGECVRARGNWRGEEEEEEAFFSLSSLSPGLSINWAGKKEKGGGIQRKSAFSIRVKKEGKSPRHCCQISARDAFIVGQCCFFGSVLCPPLSSSFFLGERTGGGEIEE